MPPDAAEREADDLIRQTQLRNTRWGAFTLTARQPDLDNKTLGGWQARCPYHAKIASSGCKKWKPLTGLSWPDQRIALQRLLHWCTEAHEHRYQKTHVGWTPEISECHPLAVIVARKITQQPPRGSVVEDTVLEKMCQGYAFYTPTLKTKPSLLYYI